MAYGQTAGSSIGSLLRFIQEQKSQSPMVPPGTDTGSPIRAMTQEPLKAPEDIGTQKVVSLKPEGVVGTPTPPAATPTETPGVTTTAGGMNKGIAPEPISAPPISPTISTDANIMSAKRFGWAGMGGGGGGQDIKPMQTSVVSQPMSPQEKNGIVPSTSGIAMNQPIKTSATLPAIGTIIGRTTTQPNTVINRQNEQVTSGFTPMTEAIDAGGNVDWDRANTLAMQLDPSTQQEYKNWRDQVQAEAADWEKQVQAENTYVPGTPQGERLIKSLQEKMAYIRANPTPSPTPMPTPMPTPNVFQQPQGGYSSGGSSSGSGGSSQQSSPPTAAQIYARPPVKAVTPTFSSGLKTGTSGGGGGGGGGGSWSAPAPAPQQSIAQKIATVIKQSPWAWLFGR